jgi:hypothetical protein
MIVCVEGRVPNAEVTPMRRWLVGLSVLGLIGAAEARANAGRPPVPNVTVKFGTQKVKLVVEEDANAKVNKVIVPAGMVVNQGNIRGFGAADKLPVLMGGLALTAAFASAGFWLVKKNRGAAGLALLASLTLFGVGALQADIARPPQPARTTPVALPADVNLTGEIQFEVVPGVGDTIRIITPPRPKVEKQPELRQPELKPLPPQKPNPFFGD